MTWLSTRRLGVGEHNRVRVRLQRGLRVPLPGGTWLRAVRYYPRHVADAPLVVLTSSRGTPEP